MARPRDLRPILSAFALAAAAAVGGQQPAPVTPDADPSTRAQLSAIGSEMRELGVIGPESLETLERLHARDPDATEMASLLKSAYLQRRDWKALIQVASERPAIRRSGQDWKDLAAWYLLDGQYEEASGILENLVRANPSRPDLSGLLGQALFYRAEYERAAALLEGATKDLAGPDGAQAATLRALIHFYRKELPEAEALLRRTVQAQPEYRPALNALGRVLAARGQLDESRKWLDEASKVQERHTAEERRLMTLSAGSREVSRAFQEGRYADAERLVAGMLPLSDAAQRVRIYRYLARIRSAAGREKEARAALREAERLEQEGLPRQ